MGNRNRNYRELRDFALILCGVTVGALAFIAFTPLSHLWFRFISGLSLELTQFALSPLKLLTIMPGIWVLLTFQRSVLVSARDTGPITRATGLELLIVIAVLFSAIRYFDVIGATAAALALILGRIGGTLCLFPPFLRILKSFNPRQGTV
jgi:O-antigen/teichoic acid export membrane protein